MTDRTRYIVLVFIIGVLALVTITRLISEGKISLGELMKVDRGTTEEKRVVVQEENAVISVVENSSPSVVAIGVTQRVINPFDPTAIPQTRESTIGTGFVVASGVLVTNRHVVNDLNTTYTVVSRDGKRYEVTTIYRDPNPSLDLALVKIDGSDLPPLELGDSSNLKVGQTVIAIGNALGRFSNTVTTGVVSGLGRVVNTGNPFLGGLDRLDDLIQTDAAINPGNSGGPLLNSSGQVIGVNVATTEGAQNIGFAIPINSVKSIVDEFVSTGRISRAFLGVNYILLNLQQADANSLPQGAYIQEVVVGSPAERAGIKEGDVITKIDGQTINEETTVSEIIQKKKVGDNISIEVFSEGSTKTVVATLAQFPNQ